MKYEEEVKFWSTYSSHLCETDKQTFCGKLIGLFNPDEKYPYSIDLGGKSVLEIGAGPAGLTLRAFNGRRKVIDPAQYPNWVWERYDYSGVEHDNIRIEDMNETGWDEVWLINVMQHIDDPAIAINKIKQSAKIIRIFEWLGTPTDETHHFSYQKVFYDQMLNIDGKVQKINQPYMYMNEAFYGVYPLKYQRNPIVYGNMDRAMIYYMKNKYNNQLITGIEIGVLGGENSVKMLQELNIEKLYLIDPYITYDSDIYTQDDLTRYKQIAYDRLFPYRDKIHWIHLKSSDAIKYLRANDIKTNFAYLDGGHSKIEANEDIRNYYEIALDVFGGHDYLSQEGMQDWCSVVKQIPTYSEKVTMGVKEAVDEFVQKNDLQLHISDFLYSDWWIDKNNT